MSIRHAYAVRTATILVGFAMLIQPFSMPVFSLGLPVMLVGILVHAVLDHLPARDPDGAGEGT